MKKITASLFFLLVFTVPVYSQTAPMTRKQFIKDSTEIMRNKFARPQFKFDNRVTFFKGQSIGINGIDAGVLLDDKLRITLGYYYMTNVFSDLSKTIDNTKYNSKYDLKYGSINTEFIYKNSKYFSLGLPVELGVGYNKLQYFSSTLANAQSFEQNGLVALMFFGLSGTFKPFRFLGLKASFGYRKTIFNQVKEIDVDGIYVAAGLALDFREVLKDYRMYRLKTKYRKNASKLETAVDLLTQ